eukprot:8906164-Alexandrium_andersonii.AAC.1
MLSTATRGPCSAKRGPCSAKRLAASSISSCRIRACGPQLLGAPAASAAALQKGARPCRKGRGARRSRLGIGVGCGLGLKPDLLAQG